MSLGAVVAMEQRKYTDDGVDTFDCAMEEFMEQTNLDVRAAGTPVQAAPPNICGDMCGNTFGGASAGGPCLGKYVPRCIQMLLQYTRAYYLCS